MFTRINEPTRLKQGDVIVIPKGVAKKLPTKASALSKHGVSIGFTGRSENSEKTVERLFTKPLEEAAGPVAYVVVETFEKWSRGPAADSYARLIGNRVRNAPVSNDPEVRAVRLIPIGIGVLSGDTPASDAHGRAAAYFACDHVELIERIVNGPVSGVMKDVFLDREWNDSQDRSFISFSKGCDLGYLDTVLAVPHSPSVLSYADLIVDTAILDELIDVDSFHRKNRCLYFTARTLKMLESRGALFVRTSDEAKKTIAARLAQEISASAGKTWSETLASFSKAVAAKLASERKRLAERASSWKKRAAECSVRARDNASKMKAQMKGILK